MILCRKVPSFLAFYSRPCSYCQIPHSGKDFGGSVSVVLGMNKLFVGKEEQKCREGDVESNKSRHLPDDPFVIGEVNQ